MSYYIASGQKNKMYTLRNKFREEYISNDNSMVIKDHDFHICTLSKFPEIALEKAKQYILNEGKNPDHYNLSTDFALDEFDTGGTSRATLIAQKTMVSGKYEGVKVEDLPEEYLKWCFVNTHMGINNAIINEYIEEFNVYEGWVNASALRVYNELKELRNTLIERMKEQVLVFGQKEYTQRMSEKTFEYLNSKIYRVYKEFYLSNFKTNDSTGEKTINLVDSYIAKGLSLGNNELSNFIVSYHLCRMFKVNKSFTIEEISFEHLLEVMKNSNNAHRFILD